jgi:hypothetical protein
VSRTAKQSAGGLLVRQRARDGVPDATFAVGRYSRNLGTQSRLGGLLTARFDEATARLPAATNLTYSLDGFVRLGQNLSWSGMVSGSGTSEAGQGLAAVSRFALSTNHFYGFYAQSLVSRGYTPGAGFIYGSNLINTNFGGFPMLRPRWKPAGLRQLDPGFFVNLYHRASPDGSRSGAFQQAEWEIFPIYLVGVKGWTAYFYVVPTWQRLTEAFAPLGIGISPGEYFYMRYRFYYGSDASKKLAFTLYHDRGPYYDGRLQAYTASLRYSPLPQASFSVDYTRNVARALGEELEDKTTELITPQVRLAVNPRLQLIGFYQKNTAAERDVWNVRLAWEFQPLSFLYLVYNSNAQQLGTDQLRSEQVIGKLTYLKQF